MQVLIIDNYDSFTYNLYQYVGEILSEIATSPDYEQDSRRSGSDTEPNTPLSRGEGGVPQGDVHVIRNDELTLDEIRERNYDRIIISPGPGSPDDKQYFGVCSDVILELGKTTPVLGVCLGMQGIGHYLGGKVQRAGLAMHGKTSQIEHDGKGVFAGLPQNIEIMRYHSLVVSPEGLPDCLEVTAWTKNKDEGRSMKYEVGANFNSPVKKESQRIKDSSAISQNETKPELPLTSLSRPGGGGSGGKDYEQDSCLRRNDTEPNTPLSRGGGGVPEIMGLRHKEYPIEGIQFHPESFATEGGKEVLRNFLS